MPRNASAVAKNVTRHASLVLLLWLVLVGAGNLALPQLESVVAAHSKSFFSPDTPAAQAASRIGALFGDGDTDNIAYLVVESDHPLGAAERTYYARLVEATRSDTEHVDSVLDMWSDPTAGKSAESDDHRAVYALVRLTGQIGDPQAARSVSAVRALITRLPQPAGVHAYLSGPGATIVDEFNGIGTRLAQITIVTVAVIAILLLIVYRSVIVTAIALTTVGAALAGARATVAFLGAHEVIEVSTFSVSLLAAMVLGAGTDYAIFLVGRYHENRRNGISPQPALYSAYRSTAPVLVASASTVAIALLCLVFTKVGVLRSAAVPCGLGVLTALAAAVSVTPALLALAARRGWAEPRASTVSRRWRRIGTAVVRWPKPILVVAVAALIICAVPAVGLRLQYDERLDQSATTPSNEGYSAVNRHFPANTLLPNYVLIETDHDMRDPQDMIAIERISRQLLAIPGVRMVQSASRPTGRPIDDAAITHQAALIGSQLQQSVGSLHAVLGTIAQAQPILTRLASAINQLDTSVTAAANGLQRIDAGAADTQSAAQTLRSAADTVSGELAPLRGFVAESPDCAANGICALVKQVVDPVESIVRSTVELSNGTSKFADGAAQASTAIASAASAINLTRVTLRQASELLTSLSDTTHSIAPQFGQLTDYLSEMSRDFAGSDEGGFYLPARAFDDPRFQRSAPLVFSPDGHATRVLVYDERPTWSADGAALTAQAKAAVHEATKEGPLTHNVVSIAGVGAFTRDLEDDVHHDITLVVAVTLLLNFAVMLAMLRSPIAAIIIVASVASSYLAALGLLVLLWQGILGQSVHWSVPPLTFVALVAVGSDYNLLLTARLREESRAGLKTGMVRAFGGTGGVVTTAGLVFGLTMLALLSSRLYSIAQIGTTIGLGLAIDTLVVRVLIVPAITVLTNRWLWWPCRQPNIYGQHSDPELRPPPSSGTPWRRRYGPRPSGSTVTEPTMNAE